MRRSCDRYLGGGRSVVLINVIGRLTMRQVNQVKRQVGKLPPKPELRLSAPVSTRVRSVAVRVCCGLSLP